MPKELLLLVFNADSSPHSGKANSTQVGCIIGVADKPLESGDLATWSPRIWKSTRLERTLGSMLAAETQVCVDGLGHLGWVLCMYQEASSGPFHCDIEGHIFVRLGH